MYELLRLFLEDKPHCEIGDSWEERPPKGFPFILPYFSLPKRSLKSRSVLQDGSRYLGLFGVWALLSAMWLLKLNYTKLIFIFGVTLEREILIL